MFQSTACLLCALVLAAQLSVVAAQDVPAGSTKIAPRVLARPQDHGVGRWIPDLTFTDITGEAGTIAEKADGGPLVIVMRDVGCPLSKKYGPRIASIEDTYAPHGARFIYLNVSSHNTIEEMRSEREQYGLDGRYIADPNGRIGSVLGATTTTEVFVLDSARTLVYRGAIDDQYGIGYAIAKPRTNYLVDALDAVLAGEEIDVAATTAPGCELALPSREPGSDHDPSVEVTYHNRISRIVQQNCLACHREGGPAPFALDTFERVRGRRGMIRFVLDEQLMPPWHAGDAAGPMLNDRSLSVEDRGALLAWIENDCPKGDVGDAPLPRAFPGDWSFEPDAVIELDRSFRVPAEGVVEYQYAYVRTDFDSDKWVEAIEVRTLAPEVTHHILVFIEEPRRENESRDEFRRRWQGGVRGYFAGLVPGQGATVFPPGFAKALPKGAWLKFQLHYTPNGTAANDVPAIAFRFADRAPEHEVHITSASTMDFEIPPGASSHEVQASVRFRSEATIMSFAPHMHLRGKAYRYELIYPDGSEELLLDIPRYDFNWQTCYRLADPVAVPPGTIMRTTAWFDNSADNPANPDPTVPVGFGEQTWDEMMIGYFEWYR